MANINPFRNPIVYPSLLLRMRIICCNDYPHDASKRGRGLEKTVAVVLQELQIVWRNPERIQCRRRWEPLQETSNSTHYIVQEFLSTGEHGFWNTTSRLEVTFSQPGSSVAKNWPLRVG
jgi:hypothetical protein